MLDRLERTRLARWAIPNLTVFLVAGQTAAWVLSKIKPEFMVGLVLIPAQVLEGEVWRLVSFLFMPPPPDMLLGDVGVIFGLLLLFMFGRALEAQWGHFRFNAFMFVGWLASVVAAFVSPYGIATNFFLMETVFLAFAYLNPNYELLLFFVLPVKVKWLALLVWVQFAYMAGQALMIGAWQVPALIFAGTFNFFLFFGPDMVRRLRGVSRRQTKRVEAKVAASKAMHRCAVCGLTDLDDPTMQFRYCSQCSGKQGYCKDHLKDHEHVR